MTDAIIQAGLWDRLLSLLTQEVLELVAFMLIGIAWSIGWTAWRKPMLKLGRSSARRRARIRSEAFWAASLPTAALIAVFVIGPPRAIVALILVLAPLSGMLSPLGYDLWMRHALPRLQGRRS